MPLTYEKITELGIRACHCDLTIAFEKKLYQRRVGTEKLPLLDAQKEACLAWAKSHITWNEETWKHVIWTEGALIKTGLCDHVYITRNVEEKYTESC